MKDICKKLGGAVVVLGIIGSIIMAVALGNIGGYDQNDALALAIFFAGIFSTALQASVLLGISEILGNQEKILAKFDKEEN